MSSMKMKVLLSIVFLISTYLVNTDARYPLRILGLFPHPGVSHFHFFHPIMRGLAEAGHDVTVVSHFPDKSPPVRYTDYVLTGVDTLSNSVDLKFFENRRFYNHFVEFFMLNQWGQEACNFTLKSEALGQVLRQKTPYDVIIIEQFNTDCMMGVAHMLKAPVIALSSCALMPWHYERTGSPIIPSHIPALFLGVSEEMSFPERLANWITFHGMKLLYTYVTIPSTDKLLQNKFGHDMPSVSELVKETSLFFVNQHFSLSGVKPIPPSVIELGGIHIQKSKPLSADLQRFLDNAEHGVIFISWGSMIRAETLPASKRDAILRAVKRLKQKVIWKWENDTLQDKPDNMLINKWWPQRDILCHPNVKVFMTHAGLMGSSEAAYCGVPTVATPMYGDQFLNAAAMKQRGMGVVLQYEDMTENSIIRALKKALEKSYMDNAKQISQSFNHRPQTALMTAIWWVEYVSKTKGAQLTKSSAVYMPRFSYYCLDIYLFVTLILSISVYSWIVIFQKICSRNRKTIKKKNE
ncbi:UDP-glycosyltransferase UGT5-like [Teleopsis dalmanni]|uniref:UDP-glycosyltransferase UGT5-like n=1 Tax=Teleopsis dalmanni TaxID=139649 RepID=UPI0018CCB1F9|nr:UDP-glycosyltransferase UGT5-like [Teleopsis dalmanni]